MESIVCSQCDEEFDPAAMVKCCGVVMCVACAKSFKPLLKKHMSGRSLPEIKKREKRRKKTPHMIV